ncbi:hypothetical protein QCE63_06110 [Caballeronia sp. LZ065]|uniref:glycan biosynthesis hexose transferase WsfD n=1 Tax=Caballeronia sp. LZ065 TaxID=3038571 RepID=UPI0028581B8E|nr:hypothetical protein [Caballeronia sp. LZ065]MDR5779004.1 hypothetical protein [Caballeronia sp. LZ065]
MYLAVLWTVSMLHVFTGWADNGDFARTFRFLIDNPLGWNTDMPDIGTAAWQQRYFHVWMDNWQVCSHPPCFERLYSFSTHKIWMIVQLLSSIALTGSASAYSVIAGSVPGRLAYAAAYTGFFLALRRHAGHRAAWAYLILITPVALSSSFIAFLNSFFEEQSMIIGLPMLGACLLIFRARGRRRDALAAFGLGCFIALSKTAYFALPLVLAPFIAGAFGARKTACAAVLATVIALLPSVYGPNTDSNKYHALYFGILSELKTHDGIVVAKIGNKPVLAACIGNPGYDEAGVQCVRDAQATYLDTVRVALAHPGILPAMARYVLDKGKQTQLPGLGMSMPNAPSFANAPLFRLWSRMYAHRLNVLILGLALVVAWRAQARRIGAVAATGLFFAAWGALQYALVLADGFMEVEKHLIGANYCLSFAGVLFAAALCASTARVAVRGTKGWRTWRRSSSAGIDAGAGWAATLPGTAERAYDAGSTVDERGATAARVKESVSA